MYHVDHTYSSHVENIDQYPKHPKTPQNGEVHLQEKWFPSVHFLVRHLVVGTT